MYALRDTASTRECVCARATYRLHLQSLHALSSMISHSLLSTSSRRGTESCAFSVPRLCPGLTNDANDDGDDSDAIMLRCSTCFLFSRVHQSSSSERAREIEREREQQAAPLVSCAIPVERIEAQRCLRGNPTRC